MCENMLLAPTTQNACDVAFMFKNVVDIDTVELGQKTFFLQPIFFKLLSSETKHDSI